jgi:oligopeptide transport system substrate-binding protein
MDPSTFLDIFHSESGNNRTGWGDPVYDELLSRAAAEPDEIVRADLYRRAEELLLIALPIAPVYQRMNFNMVKPHVRGFHDNLLDIHPLRDISVERDG